MVNTVMSFRVKACGLSDLGLVRQNNEDVWDRLPKDAFFVLADGMGGHQAGEIAAHEAVDALCSFVKGIIDDDQKSPRSPKEMEKAIRDAIKQVNHVVYDLSSSSPTLRGMGTTLCAIYVHDQHVIYGHVGDSRIYRLRHKKLKLLTKDHSLLRELVDLGQINEEQMSGFLYKNIITKAIGTEPQVEPTMHLSEIHDGDLYLMCTDGLTDLLSKENIEEIVNHTGSLEQRAHKLVDSAKEKGGHDNITVVLIQINQNRHA